MATYLYNLFNQTNEKQTERTFIFDQVIVVEGGEPGQVGQAVAPVGGGVLAAGVGARLRVVLLRLVHKRSRSRF